jgi:hypothetical protein
MPLKYNKRYKYWFREGPYSDEEQEELWKMLGDGPVAFTRPGPAVPAPANQDKPPNRPAKRSSPRPKP